MKKVRGAAMVEFAIIALLFFVLLFGIIEFARAMFTWNTMVEATRRGARVAAVCPASLTGMNQAKRAAIFDSTPEDGTESLLGLTANNIIVEYLDSAMDEITPLDDDDVASLTYDDIAFVRVRISQSDPDDIEHTLIIPGFNKIIKLPPLVTTLPAESLGRINEISPVTTRACYGVTCTAGGCS
jgi:hypothetical protein